MISNIAALRGTTLAIAAGAALLVLLGYLGGLHYRLDAFAAFRWHSAALTVLALLAACWPRRALALALLAPAVILGTPILLTYGPFGTPAAARPAPVRETAGAERPAGAPLRIMSFNTWDQVSNVDAIQQMLRAALPDVVVLIEVSPPKRALLEALRPIYPHQVECAGHWPCSMALLSRVPFLDKGTMMPNAERPSTVWARLADSGVGLTVVGVHIHRPSRSPRIHFGHMQGLAEFLRQTKGPVVVAGDFNTPAWSSSMRWLQREAGLMAMPRTLPSWPAWPVPVPQFPIDHILVSADLRLDDLATTDPAGSDHLPIIGTVSRMPPR